MKNLIKKGVFLMLLLLVAGSSSLDAYTVTLDWNNVNWSSGSLTQSFDIDPNNSGNDITITITTEGGDAQLNTGGNEVNDTTDYTGGFGTSEESVRIGADHTGLNAAVRITITFLYTDGVNDVNLTVFDVDTLDNNGNPNPNQFRDQLDEFTGENNGSTVVSAATLTRGAFNNDDTTSNVVIGDNDGNNSNDHSADVDRESGADDADGNVGVAFGSTWVDEVSFRWINSGLSGQQAIALYDITYSVPEPSTYAVGALLVVFALCHHFRKRRPAL